MSLCFIIRHGAGDRVKRKHVSIHYKNAISRGRHKQLVPPLKKAQKHYLKSTNQRFKINAAITKPSRVILWGTVNNFTKFHANPPSGQWNISQDNWNTVFILLVEPDKNSMDLLACCHSGWSSVVMFTLKSSGASECEIGSFIFPHWSAKCWHLSFYPSCRSHPLCGTLWLWGADRRWPQLQERRKVPDYQQHVSWCSCLSLCLYLREIQVSVAVIREMMFARGRWGFLAEVKRHFTHRN